MSSVFFNGRELPYLAPARSAGAFLLTSAGRGENLPAPSEPPYLFCGNGSCRDCNLLVDGYDDVPSCRLPPAAGMSLRSGEGAGEENALSRNLRGLELEAEAPLVAALIIVGAGPAGRAAAEEARANGLDPIVLDARSDAMESSTRAQGAARRSEPASGGECPSEERGHTKQGSESRPAFARLRRVRRSPEGGGGSESRGGGAPRHWEKCRPVSATSGSLHVWENGRRRLIRSRALILATGARDVGHLFDRYPALGPRPPGSDPVFGRRRREPQLALAKALGCRATFDRGLGYDRLSVGDSGATSVPGIFAAGDVVRVGDEREAVESGVRAARSAAAHLGTP